MQDFYHKEESYTHHWQHPEWMTKDLTKFFVIIFELHSGYAGKLSILYHKLSSVVLLVTL